MGKNELENRDNWQTESGANALNLEEIFFLIFKKEFQKPANLNFQIRKNPKEFKNIYKNVKLPKGVIKEIYNPSKDYLHGIAIDFAIDNLLTNKTLYIEIKRQDGWVEGMPSSAGRGNAHERLCKFFTPGLLGVLRKEGKIDNLHLPFWAVFAGNITRDPKRVREITLWFQGYNDNFFMWRDTKNSTKLINHFNKKLKPLLR